MRIPLAERAAGHVRGPCFPHRPDETQVVLFPRWLLFHRGAARSLQGGRQRGANGHHHHLGQVFEALLGRVEHLALLGGHLLADALVPVEGLDSERAEAGGAGQQDLRLLWLLGGQRVLSGQGLGFLIGHLSCRWRLPVVVGQSASRRTPAEEPEPFLGLRWRSAGVERRLPVLCRPRGRRTWSPTKTVTNFIPRLENGSLTSPEQPELCFLDGTRRHCCLEAWLPLVDRSRGRGTCRKVKTQVNKLFPGCLLTATRLC